ncbi:hypothetical protein C5167_043457 [Papaver somniferum]|uniref:Uncharacterized protein n=1 Tax=Papaver somniferum TaxID=3469 RepID=A0A4Y7L8V1_PAPSO|nr:hypothetical protein C5167_043457 [Papaver somniferum]
MKVSLLKKRVWDSLMRKNSWGCNYQRELTTPLKYVRDGGLSVLVESMAKATSPQGDSTCHFQSMLTKTCVK